MRMVPFRHGHWRGLVKPEHQPLVPRLIEDAGVPFPHGRGGAVHIEVGSGVYVRKILFRGGIFGRVLGGRCGGPGRLQRMVRLCEAVAFAGIPVALPCLVGWRVCLMGFRLLVVTEYMEGVDLVDSGVVDAWREAARMALHLNRAGFCHIDYHPRNIRVVRDGGVVLLDGEDLRRGVRVGYGAMWRRLGRYLIKHGHWPARRSFWLEGAKAVGLDEHRQERQLLLSAAAHRLL